MKIQDIDKKLTDISDVVAKTAFNIKIGEIENQIPHISGLVTGAAVNSKIREFANKISDRFAYILPLLTLINILVQYSVRD